MTYSEPAGAPLQIGFLLFPELTQLDLTGPLQVLHRMPESRTHLVAHSMEPVPSDCGLALVPTVDFAACPPMDVLIVPGGFGVTPAVQSGALVDFVRTQASTARWLGSVCTGAFVLGAAGLLRGVRATTHWAFHDLLREVGAVPVHQRVVQDGRVWTGSGVTAGIDFALSLVAALRGVSVANTIQLALEYDPDPPFASGHPSSANVDAVEQLRNRYSPRVEELRQALPR
ncbi:MAG: DJ-1/PfpI family protein [Myxococcota bacterium]